MNHLPSSLADINLPTLHSLSLFKYNELNNGRWSRRLFEECLGLWMECGERVDRLSLFSRNETIEDLQSSCIKYLNIPYYKAKCLSSIRDVALEERLTILQEAHVHFQHFIQSVFSYEIIDKESQKLLNGSKKDSMGERERKINLFKLKSQIKEKLTETRGGSVTNEDEDELRDLYFAEIWMYSIDSIECMEYLQMEINLIMGKLEEGSSSQVTTSTNTERIDSKVNVTKVTKPFMIVKDRSQLTKDVFKPGYSLPTMTIDEYLEIERKRGGILSGGSNNSAAPIDEDDEDAAEKERRRQVDFDSFKDEHAFGSGNTHNIS